MSDATGDAAIVAHGLRKSYGATEAVRGIDLEVARGEVFALLGPNGAGKTTTVEMLEGHCRRSGGSAAVLGKDPERGGTALRQRVGIVLQTTGVEPYLTVEETVALFRGYYPHPRPLDEILEVVGLSAQRRERVRRLSGGQQRRLDVAVGLAGDPELLFLDEPTTGFDPSARRGAWQLVRSLQALGKTIFLTTHYMDEAEQLADRVAILVSGEIVAEGAPAELIGRRATTTIRFRPPDGVEPPAPFERAAGAALAELQTAQPTRALHELTRWAVGRGLELEQLSVSRASLEDVYLELAGEATSAAQAAPGADGTREL